MAIDKNELRLGSLIRYNKAGETNVYKIHTLHPDFVTLIRFDEYNFAHCVCGVPYQKLIPIEITPEIMEKNGFEQTGCNTWELDVNSEHCHKLYYHSDGADGLLRCIKDFFEGDNDDENNVHFGGKYVHELQSVFLVEHIEKEVTI